MPSSSACPGSSLATRPVMSVPGPRRWLCPPAGASLSTRSSSACRSCSGRLMTDCRATAGRHSPWQPRRAGASCGRGRPRPLRRHRFSTGAGAVGTISMLPSHTLSLTHQLHDTGCHSPAPRRTAASVCRQALHAKLASTSATWRCSTAVNPFTASAEVPRQSDS